VKEARVTPAQRSPSPRSRHSPSFSALFTIATAPCANECLVEERSATHALYFVCARGAQVAESENVSSPAPTVAFYARLLTRLLRREEQEPNRRMPSRVAGVCSEIAKPCFGTSSLLVASYCSMVTSQAQSRHKSRCRRAGALRKSGVA